MMATESTEEGTATCLLPPLTNFFKSFDNSWITQLSTESPTNLEKSLGYQSKQGNRHPGRPVYNGHYVHVRPTPLKNPALVIYSEEMANDLGFSAEDLQSDVFVKYFSGDLDGASEGVEGVSVESWATPYALSIMGRRYTNNVSYNIDLAIVPM